MFDFINRHWGSFLLASALVGGAATVLFLRVRVSRAARRMREEARAGHIQWGCHAREILPVLGYGSSGELRLGKDDVLRFRADSPSRKRGVEDAEWPLDSIRVTLSGPRRDISGIRFVVLTVQPLAYGEGRTRTFGCGYQVGDENALLQRAE
jgi:hypothetical protein